MTPETQQTVQAFVASQKTANGYMNAGGHEDAYYGQFGRVLEAVFSPFKVLRLPKQPLVVKESMGRDTIYGQFFAFLEKDMRFDTKGLELGENACRTSRPSPSFSPGTNAVCCILAMQYQMGEQLDSYKSLEALAVTITKNVCVDHLRHQRMRLEPLEGTDIQDFRKADQNLITQDMETIIQLALSQLPATQRRMLEMRAETPSSFTFCSKRRMAGTKSTSSTLLWLRSHSSLL